MLARSINSNLDAFTVFSALCNRRHPFILDSSMRINQLGRYSFVGAEPFMTFSSKGGNYCITGQDRQKTTATGDPLAVLRYLLKQYAVETHAEIPFTGGAVGYFGYDLCHFIEKLPRKAIDDVHVPDCFFAFYDGIYVFDHLTDKIYIVALGINKPAAEILAGMEADLRQISEGTPGIKQAYQPKPVEFRSNMTKKDYLAAIGRIREYIRAGDVYQVNFTQRFDCVFTGDPLVFYAALRAINPAPFAAFIDAGECIVMSSSPERLIRVRKGIIETRPIKGTIPRGETKEEDEKNRAALLQSEKDRAELLMIVDLERNDLSRVAQKGTVKVRELFALETYATVHHLVGTVTAKLRPECDVIDCVRATFPGGSITGAPKIRAMEIIDELEPTQRNVYTGSLGYLGFDGTLDLNIAIRTVVIKGERAYLQAGGGIVWDSDPVSEYQESLTKARAMMDALQRQGGRNEDLERSKMGKCGG